MAARLSASALLTGPRARPGQLGLVNRGSTPKLGQVALGQRGFSASARADKQRLVILGSGWGGYEVLRKVNKSLYDVTVVSPNTYFAFTPLLASTAVGTLEFRSALEPVRRYGEQVTSYQAWADKIDFDRKLLTCQPAVGPSVEVPESATQAPSKYPGQKPFTIPYDKLVIAVGCYSQTFNTPGVKEHAFFLKDVKDARRIRSRILQVFEIAAQPTISDAERRKLLHFVVVGGGPTGIEFAAELHDLLVSDLKRAYPSLVPFAAITIYDVAPKILAAFDESLVEEATKKFARDGIRLKNNHHVEEVREASLVVREEGEVPYGMLVWSTGLAANPLIESITELKRNEKTHSLEVNGHLQARRADGSIDEDVFCIGDASALETGLCPATAQVASQEARHLSKYLNSQVVSWRSDPGEFTFKNAGIMTYIGGWNALLDRSKVETGPKGEVTGRVAWLLWRSAYWSQSMSLRNKAPLAFYWSLNWIFGRSITRF